jgi:hypothetical protein
MSAMNPAPAPEFGQGGKGPLQGMQFDSALASATANKPGVVPNVNNSPSKLDYYNDEWHQKWGLPLQSGAVTEDKATGNGLEIVRTGPGNTEYRVNGTPVNWGLYRDLTKQKQLDQYKLENESKLSTTQMNNNIYQMASEIDAKKTANLNLAESMSAMGMNDADFRLVATGHPPESTEYGWEPSRMSDGTPGLQGYNKRTGQLGTFIPTQMTDAQKRTMGFIPPGNDPKTGKPYTFADGQAREIEDMYKDHKVQEAERVERLAQTQLSIEDRKLMSSLRVPKMDQQNLRFAVAHASQVAEAAAKEDKASNPSLNYMQEYNKNLYGLLTSGTGHPWNDITKTLGYDPLGTGNGILSIQGGAANYVRGAQQGGGQTVVGTGTNRNPLLTPPGATVTTPAKP